MYQDPDNILIDRNMVELARLRSLRRRGLLDETPKEDLIS